MQRTVEKTWVMGTAADSVLSISRYVVVALSLRKVPSCCIAQTKVSVQSSVGVSWHSGISASNPSSVVCRMSETSYQYPPFAAQSSLGESVSPVPVLESVAVSPRSLSVSSTTFKSGMIIWQPATIDTIHIARSPAAVVTG
jgi:hypothetical protein